MNETLYGLEEAEILSDSVEEVLDRLFGDWCVSADEDFDAVADRISWPVKVHEYRRKTVGGEREAQRIAARVLDVVLEDLDEEFGDPDGDLTEPTDMMKAAALAFGRAVVTDYVPWQCEATGKVIEVTREEAKEVDGDE